jgi:hypothetical protein
MVNFFEASTLLNFFFKSFGLVLTLLYLIYALVIYRQTQIMLKTLIIKKGRIVQLISFSQVIVAGLLILLAFGII